MGSGEFLWTEVVSGQGHRESIRDTESHHAPLPCHEGMVPVFPKSPTAVFSTLDVH